MINISSIRLHMYCPMKLYLQTHVDTDINSDIQLNLELKKIKIDTQDLIQKKYAKIKKRNDNHRNRRHIVRKYWKLS